MKYFSLVLLVLCACNQKPKQLPIIPAYNNKEETKNILLVIEKETECFYERDYLCWKECFANTEYAFHAWNNSDGTFDAKIGWPEIDRQTKLYITVDSSSHNDMGQEYSGKRKFSRHPKVIRKNMIVHFFSDTVAYLIWNQFNSDIDSREYMHSKETRIMEKINGDWKIVNMTAFWDYKKRVKADDLKN